MSILFGCLGLSTASSVLFLCDVTHVAAKWPTALFSFTIGLVISLIYFLYFHKRQKFVKAVRNLSLSFQHDVQALLHAPGDLKTLQLQQKTLIIVDAVNVLKNILVRTYLVGNTCQNRAKITKPSLMRAYTSVNSLLKETGIDLMHVIDESKHYLTLTDHIQIIAPG